ncbi:MAG: DNA-directed RNA polymerase subunit omega [Sakamotonia sp.]|jgi:DNA-directed RNA polymerase subunit omega
MLHPSYTDLIEAVNSGVEPGEQPVVQSRYSIVIAAAKRARQLIAGADPLVAGAARKKPLSTAVQELYEQKVTILPEEDLPEEETSLTENEEAECASGAVEAKEEAEKEE